MNGNLQGKIVIIEGIPYTVAGPWIVTGYVVLEATNGDSLIRPEEYIRRAPDAR